MSEIVILLTIIWATGAMVYALIEFIRGKIPWYIFVIIVMLNIILGRVMVIARAFQ